MKKNVRSTLISVLLVFALFISFNVKVNAAGIDEGQTDAVVEEENIEKAKAPPDVVSDSQEPAIVETIEQEPEVTYDNISEKENEIESVTEDVPPTIDVYQDTGEPNINNATSEATDQSNDEDQNVLENNNDENQNITDDVTPSATPPDDGQDDDNQNTNENTPSETNDQVNDEVNENENVTENNNDENQNETPSETNDQVNNEVNENGNVIDNETVDDQNVNDDQAVNENETPSETNDQVSDEVNENENVLDSELVDEEIPTDEILENENQEEVNNIENNNEIVTDELTDYSVTFSRGDYEANLQGGSNISLKRLIPKLGMSFDFNEIDEVFVSDETILNITRDNETNDWLITSLKFFETEEILTIRLKDGTEYKVNVTDPYPDHSKILIVNGDGTYTISLDVTGDVQKNVNKVNVIIILDDSGSMGEGSISTFSPTSSTDEGLYGLIDGIYVPLERRGGAGNRSFYYKGTRYTGQRYTRSQSGPSRMSETKTAVNSLAQALLSRNGNGNPNDIVEIALVRFSTSSSTQQGPTTSYSTFSSAVNRLGTNGGTNWEAALQQALTINFNDDNQTFVIFVSDGAPTFHSSDGNYGDWNSTYRVYGSGYEEEPNMERSYTQATDDAVTLANKVGKDRFYTIFAYGEAYGAEYLSDLTTASGASSDNAYSATDTAGLQEAFNSILSKIELAGFESIGLNDGTTSSVQASSGTISGGLLDVDYEDVDNNSFKYYFSFELNNNGTSKVDSITNIQQNSDGTYTLTNSKGATFTVTRVTAYAYDENTGIEKAHTPENELTNVFKFEWTNGINPFHADSDGTPIDPIKATYTNDAVNWDLSSLGLLADGVTYTVTFDCWPSQVTLDLIADLKNGKVDYFDYQSGPYVIKEGNSYTKYSYDTNGEIVKTENYTPTSSDRIVELKDGVYKYNDKEVISPEVRKYLIKSGDNYTLLTNTEASLTFVDTRESTTQQESSYDNPDPVPTGAIELLSVTKEWVGTRDSEDAHITLYIDRDGDTDEKIYAIEMSEPTYKGTVTASIGIMTVNKETGVVRMNTRGHDYSFSEEKDLSWRWELTAPTVRPMSINGTITTLVLLDENLDSTKQLINSWPAGKDYYANGSKEYYRITDCKTENGQQQCKTKYYEVGEVGTASLTARNERRSSLDLQKELSNGLDNDEALFTYDATITTSNGEDYWFSIWDGSWYVVNGAAAGEQYIQNATADEQDVDSSDEEVTSVVVNETNKTITITYKNGEVVEDDYVSLTQDGTKYHYATGMYYAESGETVTVLLRQGWNLRFFYLPTGSTYLITEKAMPTGYTYNKVEATYPSSTDGKPVVDGEAEITDSTRTINGTVSLGNTTYKVLFTNDVETVDVKVIKDWQDENDQDGKRPTTLVVNLKRGANGDEDVLDSNGNPITATLNESNSWTATVKNLVKYLSGELISYTWVENELLLPEGYSHTKTTSKTTSTGYEITIENKYTPEETQVVVAKKWTDNQDQDGKRSGVAATVQLYKTVDGVTSPVTGKTATVGSTDNWTVTFDGLPVYENKKAITYSVVETITTANEYVKVSDGTPVTAVKTDSGTITVENKYTPKTTTITVYKIWDDEDDVQGLRKTVNAVVELTANGTPVEVAEGQTTVNVGTAKDWSYTWSNLPVYANKTPIEYVVTETFPGKVYKKSGDGEVTVTETTPGTITITNKYIPLYTKVEVDKIWDDEKDTQGLRSTVNATVQLYADGKPLGDPVKVGTEENWKKVWENLQVYSDANGTPIVYKVVETLPEKSLYEITYVGEKQEVTATTNDLSGVIQVKNSYVPKYTSVEVDKIWEDEKDTQGLRSTVNATVQLYADGKPLGDPVKVGTEENWKKVWEELQVYSDANGTPIVYTVVETLPGDNLYVVTYEDNEVEASEKTLSGTITMTNTYEPVYTSVEVDKIWEDEKDTQGLRSTVNATVQLYADGKPLGDPVKVGTEENWKKVWEELQVYSDANGTPIVYTVVETLPGDNLYVVTYEDNEVEASDTELSGTITMTNTYEPVYTSIVVNKLWDDNSDQDGMRDDASATLQLTADGDELGDPVVVEYGKDNKWTYTFDNLQVYSDANKTPIVYTVIEILPDGSVYTKTGDGEEITATTDEISGTVDITNTHTPETVKITVKKVWDDDDNRDGIRPDSVEVTLTSITDSEEEETITDVQKLNDSNKWAHEWLELPKYRNGELINYAIAETKTEVVTGVDGIGTYAIVIEQNGEVGEDIDFVVTNPHTPEVIVIKVEKIWEDQDNQDNVRPTQLTVYLLVDGEQIDSIVLNEANEWKGEFSKQPAFEKGKEISYTVAEEDLGDIYEAVIEGDARNGFTITNFYSPKGGEDVPPGPPVPKTGDNIVLYIISLILGIIGLGYSIYLKKSFN